MAGLIPRVLHQIWLGPSVLPEREAAWCDRWRAMHPEWDVRLWQASAQSPGALESAGRLFRTGFSATLTKVARPEARSEILRLELLLRYGGVYADCDCEPLRPINTLITGRSAFASTYWNASDGCCAFFGARAGHPWIRACVDAIPSLDPGRRHVFGSALLGRMMARRKDVDLLSREVVINDHASTATPTPETLVVHRFSTNRQR